MMRIWNIASWISGLVAILIIAAFSTSRENELFITKQEIDVDYTDEKYFISKKEVEKILREVYPEIDSISSEEINISMLEETLDNHPSIRKAEVYSTLDGTLRIRVNQKKPCLRVHNSHSDYYIAEQGDSMALSENYSANVPLITGAISAKNRVQVYEFFKRLDEDEFYNGFINGLHINNDDTWVLYPKPGRHKIKFGKPTSANIKLENLKVFYTQVVNEENIDSIASLDLRYNSQVICKKYE